MAKLTERKRKSLMIEERKSAKEYDSYGLHSIARDERKHYAVLKKTKGSD